MRIDLITLFPRMFEGVLSESILRIAQEKKLLRVALTNPRDFTTDRHKSVDDRPYGGGPGMVLKCKPVIEAVRHAQTQEPEFPARVLLMCPRGRVFDQALARELIGEKRLILIAPHYEGYDERIAEILKAERVSIGNYVLTGGELPALAVMDAVVRLLPGVLGDEMSAHCESFSPGNAGLLEYPQYTRPAEFEGLSVPEILLSGDHAKIEAWRREQAERITKNRSAES
ncbi:MAG TPA: tRNA (guanosine(37)-N1)-methyltransferase TrmD [Planctomycetota bacterium]|nr:tRNA (guanosine(37)-N1)-methyltransferase TrmD [Planctomycetota bacterium]